jgi:hypothetical protein
MYRLGVQGRMAMSMAGRSLLSVKIRGFHITLLGQGKQAREICKEKRETDEEKQGKERRHYTYP